MNERDCAELLLGSGLAPEDLEVAERYVSFQQQRHIIYNALRISADPAIGLRVGSQAPLSTHGALGFAAVSSADLRAALDIFVRYSPTRAGFFRFEARHQDGKLLIEIRELTDLGRAQRFLHEVLMLTLQALLNTAVGLQLPGIGVEFSYPAPHYQREYGKVFHVPVRFGAAVTALHVPEALLSRRCITADETSLRLAEQKCAKELAALETQMPFAAQVQTVIASHLEHGCTVAIIARHFRLSTRTLIRRLEQEGSSFRSILDQTRKLAAQLYLADPERSVADIASRLGYQDPSNLGRAFRGWFGISPTEFRRRQIDKADL
jgi:AraC-like DNA-binding protein